MTRTDVLTFSGTSSIVDEKTHEPILSILTLIVETVAKLHRDGHRVVLVSSGAVGVGLRRMDVDERPTYLPRIQVCARPTHGSLMELPSYLQILTGFCFTGSRRCWPVSTDESLGQPLLSSSRPSRPDPLDEKRYCRCAFLTPSKIQDDPLLTLSQRTQYVNAQNTFGQLFDMGVIPIVNENDTLAVSVSDAAMTAHTELI